MMAKDQSGASRGDSVGGGGGRLLLIVEDNSSCAATLEIALDGMDGVNLVCYRRAEEALAHVKQDAGANCCALVTDLHLPGMDGFELIRLVRERKAGRGFPIVVISGDAEPDAAERALQAGADVFFRKPFSPAKVRRTVERLLDENNKPTDAV